VQAVIGEQNCPSTPDKPSQAIGFGNRTAPDVGGGNQTTGDVGIQKRAPSQEPTPVVAALASSSVGSEPTMELPSNTTKVDVWGDDDATVATVETPDEEKSGWDCWNQLPRGSNIAERNQTVKEYYKNPPETQNIGNFTFNGKQYPEATTKQNSTAGKVTYQVAAMGYYYNTIVQDDSRTADDQHPSMMISMSASYLQIVNYITFPTPNEFSIVSVIAAPVQVANTIRKVSQNEAVNVPVCDERCRKSPVSHVKLGAVIAAIAQPAGESVARAVKAVVQKKEQNQPFEQTSIHVLINDSVTYTRTVTTLTSDRTSTRTSKCNSSKSHNVLNDVKISHEQQSTVNQVVPADSSAPVDPAPVVPSQQPSLPAEVAPVYAQESVSVPAPKKVCKKHI
jgi:hypothetical protein